MNNQNRIKVNPEFKDLILRYLKNKKIECVLIKKNLRDGNLDDIWNLGHKMKGSGKMFGFEKITEIGRALEKASEKGDFKQIEELYHQLSEYIESIEVL